MSGRRDEGPMTHERGSGAMCVMTEGCLPRKEVGLIWSVPGGCWRDHAGDSVSHVDGGMNLGELHVCKGGWIGAFDSVGRETCADTNQCVRLQMQSAQ